MLPKSSQLGKFWRKISCLNALRHSFHLLNYKCIQSPHANIVSILNAWQHCGICSITLSNFNTAKITTKNDNVQCTQARAHKMNNHVQLAIQQKCIYTQYHRIILHAFCYSNLLYTVIVALLDAANLKILT